MSTQQRFRRSTWGVMLGFAGSLAGAVSAQYCQPQITGSLGGPAHDVSVVGSTAFVADGSGLSVVDVSDPANPGVLGSVSLEGGAHVAASGGEAYVLDESGRFGSLCNMEMVDLEEGEAPGDQESLRPMLGEHHRRTRSANAERILASWDRMLPLFVKVMPRDLKRVLAEREQREPQYSSGAPEPEAVHDG